MVVCISKFPFFFGQPILILSNIWNNGLGGFYIFVIYFLLFLVQFWIYYLLFYDLLLKCQCCQLLINIAFLVDPPTIFLICMNTFWFIGVDSNQLVNMMAGSLVEPPRLLEKTMYWRNQNGRLTKICTIIVKYEVLLILKMCVDVKKLVGSPILVQFKKENE